MSYTYNNRGVPQPAGCRAKHVLSRSSGRLYVQQFGGGRNPRPENRGL